uniref:Arrestin_N domain-containing protein n=1 Tax=Heligmosomoides polygyrus TaxID=6339 RepID=A0A183GTE0_HELPZ
LPVVPPTLIGVCRLIQIYYVLRICLVDEKGNESLHLEFPLTVATVPYRIPNAPQPMMEYDFCANHVEGGKYVSPEFRLGQVYDGEGEVEEREEEVVLYRPVYAKLAERRVTSPSCAKEFRSGSFTRIGDNSQSMITESNGRRRSVIIASPVMNDQREEKHQTDLHLHDGDEACNPLMHKKT